MGRAPSRREDPVIRRLIETQAQLRGVDVEVALAFARSESGIRNRESDHHLSKRPGYMEAVAREHAGNPAVADPTLWHSYGPYMLQARYFIEPGENPQTLLVPSVNVERGVRHIRRLLVAARGDVLRARCWYVMGRGADLNSDLAESIRRKFLETNPMVPLHAMPTGGHDDA